MTGKILTANMLRDGLAVFLTQDQVWSARVDDAHVAHGEDEAKALEDKGLADERANLVVDAYLVAADIAEGGIKTEHIRERIRTLGPSVRRDLGKQANGAGGKFDLPKSGK